jgi:hypothetical protein
MRDLRYNLKYGYPIFVVLAIWLFVSAWILHKLEPRSNYWETIWVTWTTMTTMGWGSFSLQTVLGKLMISADALAGLNIDRNGGLASYHVFAEAMIVTLVLTVLRLEPWLKPELPP